MSVPDLQIRSMTADEWNADCPIGTPVEYCAVLGGDSGTRYEPPLVTRTRSEAWTLGDGTVIVKIEGLTGGVALSHLSIRPVGVG